MNRTRWLITIFALLLVANIAWYTFAHWGLITVHVQDAPLAEVIRSIERQGHATVKTDLDPQMKISLNVTKVPLAEALETLATRVEARWRLTYLVAEDAGALKAALGSFANGAKLQGWKTYHYPMPTVAEDVGPPPDPRRDTWAIKPPEEKTLQAWLKAAGQNVSAAFSFPETFNPTISATLKSGEIRQIMPKLAAAAHAKVEEVFLLQSRDGRDRDRESRGDEGSSRYAGMSYEAMEERARAEIEKLPPEKRAAATREYEERHALFAGLRDLPSEERRAKFEEIFQRDEIQERMEKRSAEHESRKTPQQRLEKAHKYLSNKEQRKSAPSK